MTKLKSEEKREKEMIVHHIDDVSAERTEWNFNELISSSSKRIRLSLSVNKSRNDCSSSCCLKYS